MSENTFTITGKFNRIDVREAKGKLYQTLILDVENGQYPQVVPLRLWGKTNEESKNWRPGDELRVRGKLGGRQWQDKVFGDITADSVEVLGQAQLPTGTRTEEPPLDEPGELPF